MQKNTLTDSIAGFQPEGFVSTAVRCVVFAVSPCPELSLTGCVWFVVIEALEGRVGTHKHNTPLFLLHGGLKTHLRLWGQELPMSVLLFMRLTLFMFFMI